MSGLHLDNRLRNLVAAALAAAIFSLCGGSAASAEKYKVKNARSHGAGSLAKAVKRANHHRGRDVIKIKQRVRGRIRVRRLLEMTDPVRLIGNGADDDLMLVGKRDGSRIEFQSGRRKRSRVADLALRRVGLRIDSKGARSGSLQVFDTVLEGRDVSTSSGIEVPRGSLTMRSSLVSGFRNDGIRVIDGDAEVARSTIAGNRLDGLSAYHGTVALRASTILANEGFGVRSDLESIARVSNSTISANGSADRASSGALLAYGGSIRVEATTIAQSRFAESGPNGEEGAAINGFLGGSIELQNTIVADNARPTCSARVNVKRTGGNVLDRTDECGESPPGDLVADPGLGPLADNGGPTLTHAIDAGSPAAGVAVPGGPSKDQRGIRRDSDPDSGAFEAGGGRPDR